MGSEYIRFTFQVDPDADNSSLHNREAAYRILDEFHGLGPNDLDVRRHTTWTFEGKLAREWRIGQAFLVGDAAHTMTPFLGEGGCSALRDAINLSWKLDLVLSGIAPVEMLNTYQTEREPHVPSNIQGSNDLAALIFVEDPQRAARRDEELISGQRSFDHPRAELGPGILRSGVEDDLDAARGMVAPQGIIEIAGKRGLFDDFYDWGFQLIGWENDPKEALSLNQLEFLRRMACTIGALSHTGEGTIHSVDDQYSKFFSATAAKYILVRPDFVVYGSAKDERELSELIDSLQGQLKPAYKLQTRV